jgi:hypothetical protein
MGGENQNGGAGSAENAPELVEVELEGKKFRVEKGVEGALMKEKDYRQKTAALAEEKRALGAEKESLKGQLEAANSLSSFLSSHEKAADVLGLLAQGKTAEARKLLEEDGGAGNDEIAFLKKELLGLKTQLNAKLATDHDAAKRSAEYAEAKGRVKRDYGIELDEIFPEMVKAGTEDKNAYVPWAVKTALPKLMEKAKLEGEKAGYEKALEELSSKLHNTPAMGSGQGADGKGGKKDTRSAVVGAYQRLQESKLRSS